jgi:ribonuclease P protein component
VKLPRSARITRRRDFLEVQERGARLVSGDLLVLAGPAPGRRSRIGITVSSKIGNAVERNRVKRWVREAFREVQAELPPVDLVVIARRGAPAMGLPAARRALAQARDRLARREAT